MTLRSYRLFLFVQAVENPSFSPTHPGDFLTLLPPIAVQSFSRDAPFTKLRSGVAQALRSLRACLGNGAIPVPWAAAANKRFLNGLWDFSR